MATAVPPPVGPLAGLMLVIAGSAMSACLLRLSAAWHAAEPFCWLYLIAVGPARYAPPTAASAPAVPAAWPLLLFCDVLVLGREGISGRSQIHQCTHDPY
jgi:hypothetical protein